MFVSTSAGTRSRGNCLHELRSPDELPWNTAAPMILATSFGLWMLIGRAISALAG